MRSTVGWAIISRLSPSIVTVARYSRAFLGRALTHLAGPEGLQQFLNVVDGPAMEDAIRFWNEIGSPPYHLRTPAEIGRFFEGMRLLEPGVVSCPHWRPQIVVPDPVDEFCAVGRKG